MVAVEARRFADVRRANPRATTSGAGCSRTSCWWCDKAGPPGTARGSRFPRPPRRPLPGTGPRSVDARPQPAGGDGATAAAAPCAVAGGTVAAAGAVVGRAVVAGAVAAAVTAVGAATDAAAGAGNRRTLCSTCTRPARNSRAVVSWARARRNNSPACRR